MIHLDFVLEIADLDVLHSEVLIQSSNLVVLLGSRSRGALASLEIGQLRFRVVSLFVSLPQLLLEIQDLSGLQSGKVTLLLNLHLELIDESLQFVFVRAEL